MISTRHCDVLVIGSGAAALTAALRLAVAGKNIIVVEKTSRFGGTSAMSGAGIWVPANPAMIAAGIEDSPQAGLDYIRNVAPPGWQTRWDRHWQRLTESGPRMIAFLEAQSCLRFSMTREHDPYPDAAGARTLGRMISTQALSRWRLGSRAFRLRRSTLPEIFTYHEAVSLDLFHRPLRTVLANLPRLAWRFLTNSGGRGQSLMIGLITACAKHGVTILNDAPATRLLRSGNRVTGAEIGGIQAGRIQAQDGVLVASGGFEWDPQMLEQYFPGPNGLISSSPGNSGDGQKMGAAIGARLDNMHEATLHPSLPARYEGQVQGVPLPYHTEPNSIIVDQSGRRFTNEQAFNIGVVLNQRDTETGLPLHGPAWVISDARYLRRLPIARWYLRARPGWVVKAPTLEALAARIDVPAPSLLHAVSDLNADCAAGIDRHFGRANAMASDADRRKRRGIEPILESPFIALPIGRAFLGTKGGLATTASGQVLDTLGAVIPGLFAAGAAAASPIGTKAVGAGTTIGPYMTSGFICAETMLGLPPFANGVA